MGNLSGTKIRMYSPAGVNAPAVNPPITLWLFLLVCMLIVTATLWYAVKDTLIPTGSPSTGIRKILFIPIVYFLLPILISASIASNRQATRALIIVFGVCFAGDVVLWIESAAEGSEHLGLFRLSAIAFFALYFWWIFLSAKIRVYFALLAGRGVPKGLEGTADELMAAGKTQQRVERVIEKLEPYTDWLVVIVVVVMVVHSIWWISY